MEACAGHLRSRKPGLWACGSSHGALIQGHAVGLFGELHPHRHARRDLEGRWLSTRRFGRRVRDHSARYEPLLPVAHGRLSTTHTNHSCCVSVCACARASGWRRRNRFRILNWSGQDSLGAILRLHDTHNCWAILVGLKVGLFECYSRLQSPNFSYSKGKGEQVTHTQHTCAGACWFLSR